MTEKSEFNPYALAHEYASYLKIKQGQGESEDAFKNRVAGVLRKEGSIIEAHEVFSGRRYDDPDQGPTGPMAGIFGAVAQAMQGREYSPTDPERQIGDDIAAGLLVQRREDSTESALTAIFGVLGPRTGMDFIEAMRGKDKYKPPTPEK